MDELNQPAVAGDSQQQPVPINVQEPVVTPQIVEPGAQLQQQPQLTEQVDKLFESKEFVDTFFSRVGDGVAKIVEKQVDKRISETLTQQPPVQPSHNNQPNTAVQQPAEPAMAPTGTGVEPQKDGAQDEIVLLKQKIAAIEGEKLLDSIRRIPQIKELAELAPVEAERFVSRAMNIAQANGLTPDKVGIIFSEGSDIQKDITNQTFSLSNNRRANIPTKNPIIPTQPQTDNKWAKISEHFYKKPM